MSGIANPVSYVSARAPAQTRPMAPGAAFWRTAALTVAPIMLFAVAAVALLAMRDNDLRRAALTRTAIAYTAEIDRAFAAQAAGLTSLSATDSLDRADFEAFYREASRVMTMQTDWVTIILSDPASGQELLNTLRPLGSPLPKFPDLEAHQRAVREKTPVFVARPHATGPTTAQPVYGMHVPVLRDGAVKYVLSATFGAPFIESMLRRTALPSDVHGLIVSEDGRLLARIAEGGAVTLTTGEAAEILPAAIFDREDAAAIAPESGWSVHLKRGLTSELQFAARRLWLLAAAGVISVAVGLFSLFTFMEQRKRAETLLEARVQARTHELAAALEQKDVLMEELSHRVNNNLQIVGSLVRVQERAMRESGRQEDTGPLALLRERLGSLFLVHREMAGPLPTVEIGRILKQVSDAALERADATVLTGDRATVRRDPALIVGFALCEFLQTARAHAAERVDIAIARGADAVHITVAHPHPPHLPPLTQEARDREALVLLLADQGRGTARIEYTGDARRLIMQVQEAV
jgi:two-component sensor histidine kinase